MIFDEWWQEYKPRENTIDFKSLFDGHMFETFGEELKFVRTFPVENIWTIIEGSGELWVSCGWHVVNRYGYFITEKPWKNLINDIKIE